MSTNKRPAILVVDDKDENLLAFDALLAKREFDLIWSRSGKEALEKAADTEFALVLLDVQMPEMDGFKVLERIKDLPLNQLTPVIFVTANTLSRDEEVKAYRLGVADIIYKPIIPEILHSKVRVFIDLYRANKAKKEHIRGELESSERQLKLALTSAQMGTWSSDLKSGRVWVSEEVQRIFGKSEISGSDFDVFNQIIHPDDRPIVGQRFEQAIKNNRNYEAEYRIVRPDGQIRWVLSRGSTVIENGEPISVSGVTVDITERKRIKEAEAEANKELVSTLETMTEGFFSLSKDHKIIYANHETQKFLSLPREKIVDRTAEELFPSADRLKFVSRYDKIMTTGEPQRFEETYEGHILQVHAYRSRDGGCAVFYRDVTDQKEAEEEIKKSQERYRTLTELIPQLVWTCLPDGQCDYLSRQWVDYTGIPELDQLGLEWLDKVIHPDDRERTLEHWLGAVKGLHPYDIEYRIRRFDCEYRWFKTRGTPVRDEAGRITYWFGTCTDIEDQKRVETQLKTLYAEAAHAREETLAERSRLEEVQEQLQFALESAKMGTWHIDLSTNIVTTSKGAAKIWGVEEINADVFEVIKKQMHPDDQERVNKAWTEAVQNHTPYYAEYRVFRPDGKMIWGFSKGETQFDNEGKPIALIGVLGDITERKEAELRLSEAHKQTELEAIRADRERAKFEAAFHAVAEGIFIFDSDGNPVFMNEGAAKVFGAKTAAEVTQGFTYYFERLDLYDMNDNFIPLTEWPVARVLRGESFRDWQIKAHRRDTGDRWIWSSSGELAIQSGSKISLAVVTLRDITKQKESEQQLLFERHKLETVFKETPAAMALWQGPDFVFEKVNPQYQAIFPDRELIGKPFLEACPEFKDAPFINYLRHVLETGEPFIGKEEYAPLRPRIDGPLEDRYYDFTYLRINDANGKPYGVYDHAIDVTERVLARKKIEEVALKLRDLQNRFERSAQATDLGVWYCDLPFDELIWNKEVKEHFFLPPDARVTIDLFYERIHPEDREKTRVEIDTAIKNKTPYNTVYRTVDPKNASNWKYIRAVGWTDYNEKGEPIRFDGITLDVTSERFKEEELKKAKDEAERANQLKSAFLANMSHEIRTPLGAMIGFADLLRDPGLTGAERSNYIDILSRNGESLSYVINDILDLSKVEAGHLTLEFSDINPEQIAADVVSLLRVKAKERDLALDLILDSSVPQTIVSDGMRIRQVLMNLVGNAVKFTQFGSVKIKMSGSRSGDGHAAVNFEIVDTGIGIPDGKVDNIFEMFVQADGSMTRRFGGTGLGLALSRSLARELGGDVSVLTTQEGKGSTFLFQVVDQPERKNTQPKPEPKKFDELPKDILKGVRILVVDDSPDNRQLIWHYLNSRGAIVDSAENGLIGYRKAISGNFDVVLMDVQMPEMDGYTATHKLRAAGYKKPIIALTAHAMSEVRQKSLNVGCTDHLTKPINAKELVTTIAHYAIH